jgi:hypothetical protein
LAASPAYAVFSTDILVTPLNTTTYTTPASAPTYLFINDSVPMPITLGAGQTMRLKMLVPPGVDYVGISAQSNDWIGMGSQAPVMATFDNEIVGACPSLSGGVYMCGDKILTPAAGGLSMQVFSGTHLNQARYMYFVLHNASTTTFSLNSFIVSMQVYCLADYKAWLGKRQWASSVTGYSLDGVNDPPIVPSSCQANLPACPETKEALLTKIDSQFTISIPNIDLNALPDALMKKGYWKTNLIFAGTQDGVPQWKLGPLEPLNCNFATTP